MVVFTIIGILAVIGLIIYLATFKFPKVSEKIGEIGNNIETKIKEKKNERQQSKENK